MAAVDITMDDELYIHPSDTLGSPLISFYLLGTENYALWSRAVRSALVMKNKIGFITGACTKESVGVSKEQRWIRCDEIVKNWIMNSVTKDLVSGVIYSNSAIAVWKDLQERFDQIDGTRIFHLHRELCTAKQGTLSISDYYTKM